MRTFSHRILDKFEGKGNAVLFKPLTGCNILSQPSIAPISIQFVSVCE